MANVIHLRCHHCGEPLQNRDDPYCPDCNLYLAYRAMPFLLGMLLLGHPGASLADRYQHAQPAAGNDTYACDDEVVLDVAALNWE